MNITWMQGFWIVWGIGFVLLGLVVWQANESGSERTKRLELERALFRCVEDMDEIAESLGVEPILVDAFNEQYRPTDSSFNIFKGLGDNKIQFSPIDSSRVTE